MNRMVAPPANPSWQVSGMIMTTMDAFAHAKRLREAWIDERRAEAMAEALAAVLSGTAGEFATGAVLSSCGLIWPRWKRGW